MVPRQRTVERTLMSKNHANRIADELKIRSDQVHAVTRLLDEGSTVPFIARYRKEKTGSLDEVAITSIRDRMAQLRALDDRKEAILASLGERALLTEELYEAIQSTRTLTALEDLYLPFRPKRRTRAMIAREKGLEPLAESLLHQRSDVDPLTQAAAFVDDEKGVASVDDALAGARDILAETVNETAGARKEIRSLYEKHGILRSRVVKGMEESGSTYRDYFAWDEPLAKAPAHRVHALLRAERDGVLRLSARPEEDEALKRLRRRFVRGDSPSSSQVADAVEDGYKRLMAPLLETELRTQLKAKADAEAVRVFAANLRELLMAAPLGQKRVLAVDPGLRTGCKVVCLNPQGQLLTHEVVYITGGDRQLDRARNTLCALVRDYEIEAIAVGNGTGSREAESLVRSLDLPSSIPVVLVNEAGASVYSASEIARRELPDQDVTVRGAVSIGRRLMDPLAELVKIDPKSIGVGQYQHDVDQTMLRRALDDTVEQSVNSVGVEVNTASVSLLSHVSGLGPKLAENVIRHRDEHGPFANRADLKKVPRLGPKAFEQSAGFLRIHDGKDPLDASAVHPERYALVRRMAKDLGCRVEDLIQDESLRSRIDLSKYVSEEVGLPTLTDILAELAKPGRDPRERFEAFSFSPDVHTIEDLRPGMILPGIVTNVVDFGAFVDVGVHQDGLVHISQLADRYVEHPSSVARVGQTVRVTVLEIDVNRRRIGLSMKSRAREEAASKAKPASR